MKKRLLLVAISLGVCLFNPLLGHGTEIIYVDGGWLSYCQPSETRTTAGNIYTHNVTSKEVQKRPMSGSLFPWYFDRDMSNLPQFPLAWSVKNTMLYMLLPNFFFDNMGRIILLIMSESLTTPEVKTNLNCGGIKALSSQPIAFAPTTKNSKIIWYDLSGTNVIARLPLCHEKANVWRPCETPVKFQWLETCFSIRQGGDGRLYDEKILHSEDFPPDGFTPVGSVRIVGKRVLSDDPAATFPPDAEWLIWEKDGGAYRLCQMREGHWSVCQDAPRKDAPKVIVINNDLDTIYLLYALAIDPADVDGSLQKITTFLQKHNALQPVAAAP